MNKSLLYSGLIILSFIITVSNSRGINGGMSCAVCTVLMGVAMQVAEIYNEDIPNTTRKMCNYLPEIAQHPCLKIVTNLEPYFGNISEKITPDIFCLAYGTCTVDSGKNMCHLFPISFDISPELIQDGNDTTSLPKIDVCKLPLIRDICDILNNSYISLDALEDFDKDGFSNFPPARGSDWRGKDCADNDPQIYPGRNCFGEDFSFDTNCNGIFGSENESTIAYEVLFCEKSKAKGLIYIGDSIGAHFHMPEVWIDPLQFSWPGLNGSDIILDEIDWPQYGFATGHMNITGNTNPWIKGEVDSIYLRMRTRNRCNHRDYQNLSQNGASSYEGINHAKSISRNPSTDKPAIVIYAMQGNDVCNNFNDTVAHMTPPRIFTENIMKTLNSLNSKLPKGSHVVLMGLVNGDFIYPAMAKKLHPIGRLHNNVYYKDLYKWFNCMEIGPCNGWLNSDENLRKVTSAKARKLTKILKNIVKTQKFDNFDLSFIKNPINTIVKVDKIVISDYLEPVDSLHPNQKAQPLLTEILWKSLERLLILGPENLRNHEIASKFGDQGGH